MAKKLHTEDDKSVRKIGAANPILDWAEDLGKSITREMGNAIEEHFNREGRRLKSPEPEKNDGIKPVNPEQAEVALKSDDSGTHIDYASKRDWTGNQRGYLTGLLSGGDQTQSKIKPVEDRPVGKLQSGEMKTIYGNRGRNLTRLEQLIASGILSLS